MSRQPDLHFEEPLQQVTPVQYPAAASIEDRFHLFHQQNPQVYLAITRITQSLKRRGFKHCGMKAIFEQLRWQYALQTVGDSFKLNNNFTAHYARLIMDVHPELSGFFELRERS